MKQFDAVLQGSALPGQRLVANLCRGKLLADLPIGDEAAITLDGVIGKIRDEADPADGTKNGAQPCLEVSVYSHPPRIICSSLPLRAGCPGNRPARDRELVQVGGITSLVNWRHSARTDRLCR